jgi:hypothetical protein
MDDPGAGKFPADIETVLHGLARDTKVGNLSISQLVQLVVSAFKQERKIYDKKIAHLQMQINLLLREGKARNARDATAAAHAEADDAD